MLLKLIRYPYLLAFFLLSFPSILFAQNPAIIWQQQYGGTGDDRMNDLLTLNTTYIAVGSTTSSDGDISANNGGQDGWVLYLNQEGSLLWEMAIGGNDTDILNAVEATEDGGFLLLGTSFSSENNLGTAQGDSDIWLVKINAEGSILWSKLYGGSDKDVGIDLTAIGEGRYAIAGYTFSVDGDFAENRGDRDACLLVVNETGDLIWAKTYGGSDEEVFNAVKFETQSQSQKIIAVGFTRSEDGDVQENKGFSDFWIAQIAAESGELLQENTYGGTSSDKGITAVSLEGGGMAILGETLSSNGQVTDYQGQGDLWLIKIAADGSLVWQKTLGRDIIETAYNLLQLQNGDLVALGTSFSLTQPSTLSDVILYKVEAENGTVVWDYQISGSGDDVGNGLGLASTGGFCLAGHTDSTDGDIGEGGKLHGSHKAWVLQVDDGSTDIEVLQGENSLDVKVFPNPIEGNRLNIIGLKDGLKAEGQYFLYNILGERLEFTAIADNKTGSLIFEVEDWNAGIYFLKVCIEENCQSFKIDKQ